MIESNDNYPMGAANDERAPYNQGRDKWVTVHKKISVVITKEIEVEVAEGTEVSDTDILHNYIKEFDDPNFYIRCYGTNLKNAIERAEELKIPTARMRKMLKGIENWKTENIDIEDV